jgi:hypothetical protein
LDRKQRSEDDLNGRLLDYSAECLAGLVFVKERAPENSLIWRHVVSCRRHAGKTRRRHAGKTRMLGGGFEKFVDLRHTLRCHPRALGQAGRSHVRLPPPAPHSQVSSSRLPASDLFRGSRGSSGRLGTSVGTGATPGSAACWRGCRSSSCACANPSVQSMRSDGSSGRA